MNTTIGQRLKKLRQLKELKQIEVSAKTKIPRSTIAAAENDINIPSKGTLNHFAQFYGVRFEWLYSGEGPQEAIYEEVLSTGTQGKPALTVVRKNSSYLTIVEDKTLQVPKEIQKIKPTNIDFLKIAKLNNTPIIVEFIEEEFITTKIFSPNGDVYQDSQSINKNISKNIHENLNLTKEEFEDLISITQTPELLESLKLFIKTSKKLLNYKKK
jgi:transcriptional regulator with XRE-family HTH domain